MAGRVTRQGSYITTKKSRRLEILSILCAIVVGIVATLVIITIRRSKVSISDRCGPKYPLFSVLLRDGWEDEDGGYVTEALTYPSGTFWKANGSVFGCPCSVKPCIRKCCPPDHDFYPYSITCVKSNTSNFEPLKHQVYSKPSNSQAVEDLVPIAVEDDHFSILYGDACGENGQFLREPDQYVEDSTFLLEDGRLMTMDRNHLYLDQSQYCLESFSSADVIHTMECFEDQTELVVQKREGWVFLLLASGMIVSVPFFLATFLVYALLPQLQNLHGKSLMCHVMSLMVAYVCLAIVQIGKEGISMKFCVMLSFIVQFTFLASFFWLNVMCFDIWWVFSGLMPPYGSIKEAEHKKFLVYSAYAWGAPLCISIISAIMEFLPVIPGTFIKPQFGIDRCWFKGADAQVLYFYLPIGVLVFANVTMFSTTSCRLKAHTSNTKVLQTEDSRRHHDNERQRFNLYLKLFVVMGVTWVMELVSFVLGGSKVIWLATDICNTLQGLLIFIMFVCKPRILLLIRQRFSPHRTGSVYSSTRTSMGRLSRSSSSKSAQQYSINPDIVGSESKVTIVSDFDDVDLLSSKV